MKRLKNFAISFFKRGRYKIRRLLVLFKFRTIKKIELHLPIDIVLGRNVYFSKKSSFTFGADCFVGHDCHFGADLIVADSVMFAPRVAVVGGDHDISDKNVLIKHSGLGSKRVTVISKNVWLGFGAVIMQGVKVGEGAVVAAGAVVTKDVSPFTVVGGNPARLIKER